ncbi:MAG: hypothetical protein ACK5ZC_03945 [Pirellulaceae bacterium]
MKSGYVEDPARECMAGTAMPRKRSGDAPACSQRRQAVECGEGWSVPGRPPSGDGGYEVGGEEEGGEEEATLRVLRGNAWPGRPCHARGQATRLRVANAARRWSAVKDGRYQAVPHLALGATKRVATKRLAMMRVAMMRVATKRVAMK